MSKVRGAQSGELTAISPTLRSHTPCPYLFVWNRDNLISIHPLLFHPSYFRLIRNSSAFTVRITSKSHVQTSRKRWCCKQEILACWSHNSRPCHQNVLSAERHCEGESYPRCLQNPGNCLKIRRPHVASDVLLKAMFPSFHLRWLKLNWNVSKGSRRGWREI